MSVHFYLLPIERNIAGTFRGPKYFAWGKDPDPPGIDCKWSMKDYGSIDMATVAADISDADHAGLVMNSDVYSYPANLDVSMAQSERSFLNTYLEAHGLPGDWLSGGDTFRVAVRTVTAMMLYNQRVCAILGYPVDPYTGITLNTRYSEIANPLHDALYQAALDLNYTWSVGNNDQVRKLLKMMADQWGSSPIYFGFTVL